MSAAVNDRPHAISSRTHLPLTGEFHPLRREFERLLATSNVIALTFAMLACTIVYFWPREATVTFPGPVISDPGVIQSPPPIDPGGGRPGMPAITPDIDKAHFEPVDEDELTTDSPPTEPGGGNGEPGDLPDGPITDIPSGPQHPLVIEPKAPNEDYVWYDREPVLLSCEPPVYPAIVREAGIDGTVLVRVLIGVNGKVKNANVVEGPSALREAALESARTAIFEPALQGIHPVEVWVVMPITFELQGRH